MFPLSRVLFVGFEKLQQVATNSNAKWVFDISIDIFEVGDSITLVEFPGCSVVADEVQMMEGEVGIQDEVEVDGYQGYSIKVVFQRKCLESFWADDYFFFHFISEDKKHYYCVIDKADEEEQIVFMVELSNTNIHQNTMMVVFMDTTLTFIAMLHSHPL